MADCTKVVQPKGIEEVKNIVTFLPVDSPSWTTKEHSF